MGKTRVVTGVLWFLLLFLSVCMASCGIRWSVAFPLCVGKARAVTGDSLLPLPFLSVSESSIFVQQQRAAVARQQRVVHFLAGL